MYLDKLIFLVICSSVWCSEIAEDEGVLVLTKDNFNSAVEQHEFILVEFYAPWCGHCKALAPEYIKAAAMLKENGNKIKLGKVDATEQQELAEKHGIRGYPTLKFFKKGTPVEYSGGRQAEDIVNWLAKKSGPAAKLLATISELEEFIEKGGNVVVVGFFKDLESEAANQFKSVADSVNETPFGLSSNTEVLDVYGDKDGDGKVIVFKTFDERRAELLTDLEDYDNLKNFIAVESLPLITEFNHQNAAKIFGGSIKSHLMLFLSKEAGHHDKVLPDLKPIAKEFKSGIFFVTIDVDEQDHNRIMEYFGITTEQVPTMRIIRLEDDMIKYKPETSELSYDKVRSFVQSYIDGKLKEHLLSQDLPEDWDKNPVKVLVSTNFDEVVFNKDKDVLVEFYAPWCGHCKNLVPIYDKLAENFQDKEDVVIAKFDATANELEHTKIGSFPTIKLYKKGNNEVVDFGGDRTLEALSKFIETGGEHGQQAPEPEDDNEEEEEDKEEPSAKDEL